MLSAEIYTLPYRRCLDNSQSVARKINLIAWVANKSVFTKTDDFVKNNYLSG